MAWVQVTVTIDGKRYGVDLSDDEYVMDGDDFHAFAIRRTNGWISHYVWNPKRQSVSNLRRAFGGLVAQIPDLGRSAIQSVALSTVGAKLAGPAGRGIGVLASKVVSFDGLWKVLSVHEDKEVGYYEVESGQRSTAFPRVLTVDDIELV